MEYDLARELEYEAARENYGRYENDYATATALCRVTVARKNDEFAMEHKCGPSILARLTIKAEVDDEGGVDVSTAEPIADNEFEELSLFTGFKELDPDIVIVKINEIVDCSCWD